MAENKIKSGVIYWLFVAISAIFLLIVLTYCILIFSGALKLCVVKTDLEPHLYPGDVIVYKEYSDNLQVGDFALYTKSDKTIIQKVEIISHNGTQKTFSGTVNGEAVTFNSNQVFGVFERKSNILTFIVAVYTSTAGIIVVSTLSVLIIAGGIVLAKITNKKTETKEDTSIKS